MQTFRVTRRCPPPPSRVAVTAELLSDQFLIRQWKTSPWRGWVLASPAGLNNPFMICRAVTKFSQYSRAFFLLKVPTSFAFTPHSLHQTLDTMLNGLLNMVSPLEIGTSSWLILWKCREVSLLALIAGRCCRLVPRGRACCRARAATSRWTRCGAPPLQAAPSPCSTPSHTPAAIGENRERYYLIFRESATIVKQNVKNHIFT